MSMTVYLLLIGLLIGVGYLCARIAQLFKETAADTATIQNSLVDLSEKIDDIKSELVKPAMVLKLKPMEEGKVRIYKDGELWQVTKKGSADHLEAINDPTLTVEPL